MANENRMENMIRAEMQSTHRNAEHLSSMVGDPNYFRQASELFSPQGGLNIYTPNLSIDWGGNATGGGTNANLGWGGNLDWGGNLSPSANLGWGGNLDWGGNLSRSSANLGWGGNLDWGGNLNQSQGANLGWGGNLDWGGNLNQNQGANLGWGGNLDWGGNLNQGANLGWGGNLDWGGNINQQQGAGGYGGAGGFNPQYMNMLEQAATPDDLRLAAAMDAALMSGDMEQVKKLSPQFDNLDGDAGSGQNAEGKVITSALVGQFMAAEGMGTAADQGDPTTNNDTLWFQFSPAYAQMLQAKGALGDGGDGGGGGGGGGW